MILLLSAFSPVVVAGWTDVSPSGYSAANFQDVYFVNNNTGFVVGSNSTILRTDDGGVNWTPATSVPTANLQLYNVQFPENDQVGYVSGDNGNVWKTTDGGDTWVDDSPPGNDLLYGMYFVDNSTGYVGGTNAGLYRGTNCDPGPCTWTDVSPGGLNAFQGFYFTQATTGYLVGNTNTVRFTSNSGASWEAQTPPDATPHVNEVVFPVDINTGYIVSNSGRISKTTNGGSGATWTTLNSGVSADLKGVSFPGTNTTGYVAGFSGTILKTTDGGSSWENQFTGTTSNLLNIHFPVDASTGYAVGVNGTVLKTSDSGGNNFYMHPVANASTQFGFVGVCSTSYQCINDQNSDAATGTPEANDTSNYVQSIASASVDLYELSDNEIPAGSTVTGITITAQLGRDNGPSPTMYLLYQRDGIDGSPVQGPAITSIGTTCCTTSAQFTVTNLDWSLTELNKLRIGFQHDGTNTVYVSQLYVQVAYTAGNGSLSTISGQVFNDADFDGTATVFQAGDTQLGGVDVELYRDSGGSDVYFASTTTDGSGNYSFSNVEDGTYRVRVRSASIGGSNPAPEMTWANGAAAYGGQDPNVDDTLTGDNAGAGDTYASVVVSSADVAGVDFGFAYNLIVNTNISGQGSLGQFVDIANTSALLGANNKTAQFRISNATNRSNGGDNWHGIAFSQGNAGFAQLGGNADSVIIDGSTQTTNVGDSNSNGPEIELYCSDCTGTGSPAYGFDVNADNISIANLTISGFNTAGIRLAGGQHKIYSNYIGTNGVGTAAASPSNTTGIILENIAANYSEIGNYIVSGDTVTSGLGNVISGNGTGIVNRNSSWIKIRGNLIGTDAAGTGLIGNTTYGIELRVDQASAQGVIVGGNHSDKANVIAGGTDGIVLSNNLIGADIQGNYIGTDTTGAQDFGGTGSAILANSTNSTPAFKIGGLQDGEGNTIANYGGVGINYTMANAGTHLIQGNSIKATGGNGIVVSTAGVRIEKNIVYDLTGGAQDGISVSGPGEVIYHNTIHNVAADGIDVQVGAASSVVRNNSISSATGSDVVNGEGLADTRITYNNFFNNGSTICSVSCDSSNTANDPVYLLPASGNFNLSCSSLLIDAGLDIDTLGNGEVQTDLNGATAGKYTGTAPDMGALDGSCGSTYMVSGTVFNDADFTGTASAYDGGVNDVAISGADVEIYSDADVYLGSQTTAGDGSFSFTGIADGTYKLRVRSATINGANIPELAWANGGALYGGQDASVDDTASGDNAGPGDTYATIVVSGGNLVNVEFGFAYNLITNVNDSGQGSLREFMENANAGVLGAGNNTSQFRIGVPANQSSGGDSWWRITPASELPQLTTNATGIVLDATTQETYIGGAGSNSLGPDVEIYGASCGSCDGIYLFNATDVTIKGFVINSFSLRGINIGGSAPNTTLQGNYIGTDATGTSDLGSTSYGVLVTGGSAIVGGTGTGEGNVISGNDDWQIYLNSAPGYFIRGNKIGTNATGNGIIHANPADQVTGIYGSASNGTIGGSAAGAGNLFGGNDNAIATTGAITSLVIQGNTFGTDSSGTLDLGNKQDLSISSSAPSSNIKIGGVGSGEGNLFANANTGARAAVTVDLSNTAGVNEISGNIIRDTEDTGIRLLNGQTVEITKNVIVRAGQSLGDKGIVLSAGDGTRVYHNTLDSNFSGAIDTSNTTNVVIRNNIISNHSDGADIGINDANNNISIISNNLYFNNGTDCSGTACAGESGKVTASPQFVGASTDDYRLLCGSQAIDAAIDLAPIQSWTKLGSAYDIGAEEQPCVTGMDISGRVFLDDDFSGTASTYDGGTNDVAVSGVDVELYDNSDVYQLSTTTAGDGSYSFSGLTDGTYKIRVRSATVSGGSPVPELAWANGAALYGGQDATVDDTGTGDNAGIGDTYVTVVISGGSVSNVDFGFAYNLIVNTEDSGQGSLRQFMLNAANGGLGVNNSTSHFRMQVATNQTNGTDNWWRISPLTELPTLSSIANNTVLDASTQRTNSGSDDNSLGPEIEINGASCSGCDGFVLSSATGVTIHEFALNGFVNGIDLGASAANAVITGNYIGVDATGTVGTGNSNHGINVQGDNATIGGSTASLRNVISANTQSGIQSSNTTAIANITIQGNYIGTNATGTAGLGNGIRGITLQSANASSNVLVGGVGVGEGNLVGYTTNTSGSGIFIDVDGGTHEVSGNTIRNTNGIGLYIFGATGLAVQKNIIHDIGDGDDNGIYVWQGSNINFFHNTVYNANVDGINIANGSSFAVQNNIFSNNGNYAIFDAAGAVTTISNNNYYANANVCSGTNCGSDSNSITTDPLFVDTANADFRLTECSSGAINTGVDLGGSQPDLNGATAGNFNGSAPDMGALESSCASGFSVSGVVFEDANYAGVPTDWDSGTNDLALENVTVELYDSGDSLVGSTTTAVDGSFSFVNLADDTYKVRAVTSTIGDADTIAHGGFNACVPATCSYPVPEMTWGYNAAKLGGTDKNVSDVGAAAPGDTFASVTISGADVLSVNLGFAYNAIVNTNDSGQGSFRQFILNANAIGAANGTTANTTEFDTSVFTTAVTVQITPTTAYPEITDDGTVIDASDNRIILWGASVPVGVNGLTIQSSNNVVKGISIQYFTGDGVEITSGSGNILGGDNTLGAGPYKEHIILLFNGDGLANGGDATDDGIEINSNGNFVYAAYIGTDGAVDAGNTGNGIYITGDSNTIGGATAETWNLISGNDQNGIYLDGASSNIIQGNYIGTNSAVDGAIANSNKGIWIANASVSNTVGGDSTLEANVISGNNSTGVYITDAGSDNNVISGNYIGTNSSGATNLGNNGAGVYISVSAGATTIGGAVAAEGNVIAGNVSGIEFNTDSVDAHFIGNNYIGTNSASDVIPHSNYGLHCNQVNGVIALIDNVISNSAISGINGACLISLSNTNDVNDDITLSSATLNMNTGVLNLSGNMNNSATTITAGTSSILVLDGTAKQSITAGSGTTNFNTIEVTNASSEGVVFDDEFTTVNFVAETPNSLVTFTSGVAYTFTGTLTLNGQDDTTRLKLTASGATPYTFDIQSETQYAYFVDVDYSYTETNSIIAYESVDPSSTTDAALASPHWIFESAIVVNTTTDDGNPDSLRQAFINAVSGQDIVFNPKKFPSDDPSTITITSSLAAATDNLIITGENAGVIIDGGGTVATCLTIDSSNVTVRGLRIQNCTENGILINSGTNNVIGGNNTSGKGPSGEGNILVVNGAGSLGNGLRINSSNNFAYGNYIGIAPSSYPGYSAAEDLGNVVNGILIAATASGNIIGDTATGRTNILSANNTNGITVAGNSNTLVANYIGMNEDATAAMGNTTTGVLLSGSANGNNIGGTGNNEGNLIAGNAGDGVVHDASGTNNAYGNTVSQTAFPNGDDGIESRSGTIVLGVNGGAQGNVVAGNTGFGIHVNGGAVTLADSIDINDDVRVTAGSVDMGNATIKLSGNWVHVSGGVTESTSTLLLDSTAVPQDVNSGTGNNFHNIEITNSPHLIRFLDGFSCNNFTAVTPGSNLQFQANETVTVNGVLNVNGQAAGTEISLSSSDGVDQFTFNTPNRDQSVSYVNVTRSNADGNDIYAYFPNTVTGNDDGEPSPHWIFSSALSITKKAFLADGTPIATGATVPRGTIVKYLLYVNNFQASGVNDVSIIDVLDSAFTYQTGTTKVDNSIDSCAQPICSSAEEAAIFAAINGTAALTDAVDGDVVSYTAGTTTVEAGDAVNSNQRLDILASKVWAMLITVKMQ